MNELVSLLKEKNLKISFAESMTGGLLSHLITKHNGASKIFNGSIICYSDEVKINLLNVSPSTIKKYSVVSYEVANEMVLGLKKLIESDIYVSITGNAGPSLQDNTNKYICYYYIYYKNNYYKECILFYNNNRNKNIEEFILKLKNTILNII